MGLFQHLKLIMPTTPDPRDAKNSADDRSEFLDALRKGALLGVAILIVVLPPMYLSKQRQAPVGPVPPAVTQNAPPAIAPRVPEPPPVSRMADFGPEKPSPDVRKVAQWAAGSNDHKKMSFVVIDKKAARLYVFDNEARLKRSTPILLGAAVGDDSAPGIGDKPLSQVKASEKTTPAGRFIAEPGRNTKGEDIIWVDYDSAVSMHRLRYVSKQERRAQRLASPTEKDNRISFGCINVPVDFYETVLSPTVKATGAIVYVLPEVRSLQEVFGLQNATRGGMMHVSQRQKA
jgi:hypothetical protein